ncbi:DUF1778 domain-containing protein [Lautropia mirabilis]|uniref:type II toxin-antitoxin system TacA family antitoxin n=1 Tax=Lautropia mirabilis TaxID=47671 RepID=UPI002349BF76|nr:DUF1778 domain-containing protein [Lautropia mirabilis]MDC6092614.1 DUF1778 domain-containing protein [Lautropia mirabilis]
MIRPKFRFLGLGDEDLGKYVQGTVKKVQQEGSMQTKDWFDLKIDAQGKDVIAKTDLTGTTMAAFVRGAAVERAQELLEREARISLSPRDVEAFTQALDGAFKPNAALEKALTEAREKVRRV